jgi:hypothetical protein
VASAPASKQASTRGSSAASPSRVRERTMKRPVTEAGMMLAAPAVGDDPVHLVARAELLAHEADGHLGDVMASRR